MGFQLGLAARLYRNTGNYGTPVWNIVNQLKDLTLNMQDGEVDVSCRAGAYKLSAQGLREFSLEFDYIYDNADDDCLAMLAAFGNKTNLEVAVLDASLAASGKGWRMVCAVMVANKDENLEDKQTLHFTLKPTLESGNTHNDPSPVKCTDGSALVAWAYN